MTNILQITPDGAKLCDEYGDTSCAALSFSLGQQLNLLFDLRGDAVGENGKLLPYAGSEADESAGFYFAVGSGWGAAAEVLLLRTGEISFARTAAGALLEVDIPDTGTERLIAALAGKANAEFFAEIGALDGNGKALAVWQFKVKINNRIYIGGEAPPSVSGDPDYLTSAEVLAIIAERLENVDMTINAGPGIAVSGNTVSAALTSGIGIAISGGTVRTDLAAGTGIAISGNTISSNLTAGSGISIAGNTISSALEFGDGLVFSGNTLSMQLSGESGIFVTDDGDGGLLIAPSFSCTSGLYFVDGEIGICIGSGLTLKEEFGDPRLVIDFADDSEVVDGSESEKSISPATLKTELDRRLANVAQSVVSAINYTADTIVTNSGTAASVYLGGGTHHRFTNALEFLEIIQANGIAGRQGSVIFTMASTSNYQHIFWCDPAFRVVGTIPTVVCGGSYIATVLDGVLKIEEFTPGVV